MLARRVLSPRLAGGKENGGLGRLPTFVSALSSLMWSLALKSAKRNAPERSLGSESLRTVG